MTDPSADKPLFENDYMRLRRCRRGVMLYNTNDEIIGTMLDLYGEFSEQEDEVFEQILQPGMTVVEAGANIGAHTLALAQRVGPRGRVLAFEPQRFVFQILCANLGLNRLEHVEPRWAGVGSVDGFISVPRLDPSKRVNFGGLSLGREWSGDRVPLVKLDSLDLPACHLLKIDVEGMEVEVIRGAADLIRRHAPMIYTENDRADKSPALIEQLLTMGYRCYWHLPPYVRVPNFRGNDDNRFPGLISVNMLCVSAGRNIAVNGFREVTGPEDTWQR
ncbi:MAG: FkbM family methyltransferase [Reyranellaceae bacterium]